MGIWDFLLERLQAGEPAALLLVVEHRGSSPGKTGFSMAVSAGAACGSIGGGSVEQELAGRARQRLGADSCTAELVVRHHHETAESDRSGMICSGSQTTALLQLGPKDLAAVARLREAATGGPLVGLKLTPAGLELEPAGTDPAGFERDGDGWSYRQSLGRRDTLYIFGGGHVGLALSRAMAVFDFRLVVIDDRPGLDTMAANSWAHQKQVTPFEAAADQLTGGEHEWAVIMTFGHAADEGVLRRLVEKPLRYLGLLGSPAKVAQLFDHLRAEGVSDASLARVHAPVGLPIGSRTPEEIAVSIAAEIIQLRNRG